RREVVPAVEVEADGGCVELGPVRKLDALAELERPRETALVGLPARRKLGHDRRAAELEADQAVEDLVGHPQRRAVGNERWVEQGRIGLRPKDHRCAGRGAVVRSDTASWQQ